MFGQEKKMRKLGASLLWGMLALGMSLLVGCGDDHHHNHGNTSYETLAIADGGNNRVLVYNSPFSTGANAAVVLGQAAFTTNAAGTTTATLNDPLTLAYDTSGNLWVSDLGNQRVLGFKAPLTTGMSATVVLSSLNATGLTVDESGNLWVVDGSTGAIEEFVAPVGSGQAASLTIANGVTQQTTMQPSGLAFSAGNDLWVADVAGNRVLRYSAPLASTSLPSLVLGQTDTTSVTANQGLAASTAATLSAPTSVSFDESGYLWVADAGNHRVLAYEPNFTTGQAAAGVIGQADFVSNQANRGLTAPTAATLDGATDAEVFADGTLMVVDTANNRTLFYPSAFSNGMAAAVVLGQSSMIASTANQGLAAPTAATQSSPY